MADIYSKAAKVLVWLGLENKRTRLAINLVLRVARRVKVDAATWKLVATADELHWADTSVVLPFDEAEYIALYDILTRPWFERLWVWQEVLLATGEIEIIIGRRTISMQELHAVVVCLQTKPVTGMEEEFLIRVQKAYSLCTGINGMGIDELVEASKFCICSDPRDKIYGLLSLLDTDISRTGFEPDYTMSTYQVYQSAALSLIKCTKRLDVMTTVENHKDLEGVPSWVPNVSTIILPRSILLRTCSSNCYYSPIPLLRLISQICIDLFLVVSSSPL
jgi:hypothetical protein